MKSLFVSVIIPVYNDWKRLALCVNALTDQTYPKDMFEVIIVNNNPPDTAPDDFSIPDNCTIIEERTPGSYSARNAALKIVKGEIIGFTDSDCVPDKDWIKNAVDYFEKNKNCSRIAGKISIFFNSPKPTKAELYDKLYAFNQKEYVDTSGTCVTANLFTYKLVFDNIGFFNEALMSGGDFSWGTLAHKKGFKIDYAENVVVHHPARANLKELIKKEKRVGGSQANFLKKHDSFLINLLKFSKELIPRYKSLRFIYRNGKNLSTSDKMYTYIIRQYLLGIRAYERFRVQTGKEANRA